MTEAHFGSTLPGFNSLDIMFETILSLRKKSTRKYCVYEDERREAYFVM